MTLKLDEAARKSLTSAGVPTRAGALPANAPIAPGDVVLLASGSRRMTVDSIAGDYAQVVWFDMDATEMRSASVRIASLRKLPADLPTPQPELDPATFRRG